MSRHLLHLFALLVFGGYLLTWQINAANRRRRRRAVTAAHSLPRPPRRQMPVVIVAFVAINLVGIAVCVVVGTHYLGPTLFETTTLLVIVSALILVTIPSLYVLRLYGRDPIVTRADSLDRTGRRADAIALLESTLATTAPTASRHAALGLLFSKDDRCADAERCFARATDLDPSNPNYPIFRSVALCELSRPADALAVLDAARAAHPYEAALLAAACLTLLDLSRDDEARELLRQADDLLCTFPRSQLTGSAPSLLHLCRPRLDPSTRAFPVQTPPIP